MGNKNVPEVQEAVALLNQEYLQSFSVTEGTRTQDLQKICRFLEQSCKEQHTVLSMEEGNGKAGTRNIWNCSNVSGTADHLRLAYSQLPGTE